MIVRRPVIDAAPCAKVADRCGRPQGRRCGRGHSSGLRLTSTALRRNSRLNIAGACMRSGCPLVGEFRSRMRWSPPGSRSAPASEPKAVFATPRTSRRREGPAGTGCRAQRRADLCRLRAQARRAGEGAAGAAALRQTQARCGVRRRRRPRCRQTPADGGAIATEYADRVIVTDDNPRHENPDLIRSAILSAAKGARKIGDRAEAIRTAIAGLEPGDALLIRRQRPRDRTDRR